MKLLSSVVTLAASVSALAAQAQCCFSNGSKAVEMGIGYQALAPMGTMANHAGTVHGVNLYSLYRIPGTGGRFAAGFEMNSGSYASFTKKQEFGVGNVTTPMDVRYNSNVTMASLTGRMTMVEGKNIEAYAGVKGGIANFASNVQIQDPHDADGCEPIDTKSLISDNTWQAGATIGSNIDMKAFAKKLPAKTFLINVHAGYTQGGSVDYINVRHQEDASAATHHGSNPSETNSHALTMRFVNLQTNEQHSHEVARVYNNPVQFFDAGVSLVVRF